MKLTNSVIARITKLAILAISCAAIINLSSCSNSSAPNETMGSIFGGNNGQFMDNSGQMNSATGAGVPPNGPGPAAENMDNVDNLNLNNSLQNQSDNKSTTWVNPNSNVRYTVTPTTTVNDGNNYCRDYSVNKIINGQSQTVTERACRVNGRWVKQ